MRQFLIQTATFLLSSLLCVATIYLSKPYHLYQQIIPILLVLDIIIISRINTQKAGTLANLYKQIVLLISSLVVQLIVISSGGFYSPLLILLHIFALGAIFVLSSSSPIIFLVFSLGVLIFHISFDQNLFQFFQNDPWAVVIYASSIVIVIPLALYLSRSNRIKDKFNNFLKDYIAMSEKTQKSIMTALSNMVIITDKDLNVISINIAVERLLRVSASQVKGESIFDFLTLKDSEGNKVPPESLPIKEALADKATHFVEGYNLETKLQALPKPITIQVRPLTNISGAITQIVFVLTDPLVKIGFNTHPTIKEALRRRDSLLETITKTTTAINEKSLQESILLITHIEEDVLTVQEMEDHPLQEVIGFSDLVEMANQIVNRKKLLYSNIGALPEVSFDDENKSEAAFLNLQSSSFEGVNFSKYSAPIDSFLVNIILEKLIDLSVFLTGKEEGEIQVFLSLDLDGNIKLTITFPSLSLTDQDLPKLLIKDYPGLNFTQLKDTSGLEGYIAGRISRTIQQPIDMKINAYKKIAEISLTLQKQAKIYTSGGN